MAQQIRSLQPGTKVVVTLHGSKQFGNQPCEINAVFIELSEDGNRAEFDSFELYRLEGRWAHGMSAERATLKKVLEG